MFDKAKYRRRREMGLRGQEDDTPEREIHYGVDWPQKPVSKKALLKNTKRARKAVS